MGLSHNMPNVCNALGGRKFETSADVTLLDRYGPRVGANTEFTYSVNTGHSGASAPGTTSAPARPGEPVPGRRPRHALPVVPAGTAVVFPCAAAKAPNAGHLEMPDGRRVFFVADPREAPVNSSVLYRRPDDRADSGHTFREKLCAYNLDEEGNPWGLLPAWQLYGNGIYSALADRLGTPDLFILSAGWGLIRADYLTPNYDITFSANAERYKRRPRRHGSGDFRQLLGGDHDRIVFAGGKDYLPMFLSLTDHVEAERVVYYNSASTPRAGDVRFVRFETRTRTNWHYKWARGLLDGEVQIR